MLTLTTLVRAVMLSSSTYQHARPHATPRPARRPCPLLLAAWRGRAAPSKGNRVAQTPRPHLGGGDGRCGRVVVLDLRDPARRRALVDPSAVDLDADLAGAGGLVHPPWQRACAQSLHGRHVPRLGGGPAWGGGGGARPRPGGVGCEGPFLA